MAVSVSANLTMLCRRKIEQIAIVIDQLELMGIARHAERYDVMQFKVWRSRNAMLPEILGLRGLAAVGCRFENSELS